MVVAERNGTHRNGLFPCNGKDRRLIASTVDRGKAGRIGKGTKEAGRMIRPEFVLLREGRTPDEKSIRFRSCANPPPDSVIKVTHSKLIRFSM